MTIRVAINGYGRKIGITQLYGAALGMPLASVVVITVTGSGKKRLNISGASSMEASSEFIFSQK